MGLCGIEEQQNTRGYLRVEKYAVDDSFTGSDEQLESLRKDFDPEKSIGQETPDFVAMGMLDPPKLVVVLGFHSEEHCSKYLESTRQGGKLPLITGSPEYFEQGPMIAGDYAKSRSRVKDIEKGNVLRIVKYLPQPGKESEFKALLEKMSEEYQYKELPGNTMYSGCFTTTADGLDGGVMTAMMFDSEAALGQYKVGLRDKYLNDLKACIQMPAAIDDMAASAFAVRKGF